MIDKRRLINIIKNFDEFDRAEFYFYFFGDKIMLEKSINVIMKMNETELKALEKLVFKIKNDTVETD
jgi:hypothetical protein